VKLTPARIGRQLAMLPPARFPDRDMTEAETAYHENMLADGIGYEQMKARQVLRYWTDQPYRQRMREKARNRWHAARR
jgi:hypothetical protein